MNNWKNLTKGNPMLIVSILLPLLLVVLFLLARMLPVLLTAPPAYDLLLTRGQAHYGIGQFANPLVFDKYSIVDGQLHMQLHRFNPERELRRNNEPELFHYSISTGSFENLNIDYLSYLNQETQANVIVVPVNEAAGLRLSTNLDAPDGYRFERVRNSGGGILIDLMGVGNRGYDYALRKSGRVQIISSGDEYFEHLAWILDQDQ